MPYGSGRPEVANTVPPTHGTFEQWFNTSSFKITQAIIDIYFLILVLSNILPLSLMPLTSYLGTLNLCGILRLS